MLRRIQRSSTVALVPPPVGLLLLAATRVLIVSDYNLSTALAILSSSGYINTLIGSVIPLGAGVNAVCCTRIAIPRSHGRRTTHICCCLVDLTSHHVRCRRTFLRTPRLASDDRREAMEDF